MKDTLQGIPKWSILQIVFIVSRIIEHFSDMGVSHFVNGTNARRRRYRQRHFIITYFHLRLFCLNRLINAYCKYMVDQIDSKHHYNDYIITRVVLVFGGSRVWRFSDLAILEFSGCQVWSVLWFCISCVEQISRVGILRSDR